MLIGGYIGLADLETGWTYAVSVSCLEGPRGPLKIFGEN